MARAASAARPSIGLDDDRTERDLLGERRVPRTARYGVHTARAAENFKRPAAIRLGDVPEFATAFGMVKLAALRANVDCGVLAGPPVAELELACQELIDGDEKMLAALVVPLLQGGAGTSTNMCVNEVLANRTLELSGCTPGSYAYCHPNDHVNRSQSTNDAYPTALHLALIARAGRLDEAIGALCVALRAAGMRWATVTKLSRTQLQDAVPMTVRQELDAWAHGVEGARDVLAVAVDRLHTVNLGGTAIGTGLTAPGGYRECAVAHLASISGRAVVGADDLVAATTDPGPLLGLSSALRQIALSVAKIANDLRLLASGPLAGLAEYQLPAVQAGSSMMPGKVNPVVPEFVNQLAFRVRGADMTVALALDAGQLQLQAMLPVVAEELLQAEQDLTVAFAALKAGCIDGLAVDARRLATYAGRGLGELTELAATRGYAQASRRAVSEGRSLIDTPDPPTER